MPPGDRRVLDPPACSGDWIIRPARRRRRRIRARLSTSVPADPRLPAVTVKRLHLGRGGGGDGGAARKSTARTEGPTMAAGSILCVIIQRLGVAAKTRRPDLLAYGLLIGMIARLAT